MWKRPLGMLKLRLIELVIERDQMLSRVLVSYGDQAMQLLEVGAKLHIWC